MDASVRNQYLNTEVMTATPQKLHLMVLEAAIRSCEKGRSYWQQDDPMAACEALIHAQDCVGELLATLNQESGLPWVGKMASVYMFIFRQIVDANNNRDEQKLDEALKVLHTERETWRQVCEKFGSQCDPQDVPGAGIVDTAHSPASGPTAGPIVDTGPVDATPGGFSLEA